MRRQILILTASLVAMLSASSMAAEQAIQVNKGWNLKGSRLNGVEAEKAFNDGNVNTVWKWTGKGWAVWSPNPKIMKIINDYGLPVISQLNAGEGFWINAKAVTNLKLSGEKPSTTTLSIKKGWQLVALKSNSPVSVEKFSNPNITTIWKWTGKGWAVWSPNPKIMKIINDYGLPVIEQIEPGEGFWINAGGEANVDTLETPPAVGFAYVLKSKLNAVPLKGADVYINGQKVGTTDEKGQFSIEGYPDGTEVVLKKKGYAVGYGIIEGGKVVILTQKDYAPKVPLSATGGQQKVAKKGITSQDGTLSLVVDKINLTKDLTVSVIPYMSTSAPPPLNPVQVNGEAVPPEQMAIIGGGFINVEDSNGNLLSADELKQQEISFKVKQSSFLGDLQTILNGDLKAPSTNFQKFSEEAYNQLKKMIDDGMADLLVLQFIDGKWQYKGKAEIEKVTVKQKVFNKKTKKLETVDVTKYILESKNNLDQLAPIAFVLKMNYLTGEATICAKEGGYKMFDGSIVTEPQNGAPQFDWINDPVPDVVIIGDDSVVGGAELTNSTGCAVVTYKVPFLKPTFTVALKKDGYYDSQVTCEVSPDGAKCEEGVMYRVPKTASIEGYVRNKVTKEGIPNALVTLTNPEVLSADKVETGVDDEGYAYVKVGYMPNVKYTWEAIKYVDNGTPIKVLIKEGKGDPKYAQLSEKEIFEKLVAPFDNGTNSFAPEYLTGTWTLHVKAEHTFTNTDKKLVEEATGSFDIDILFTKLAEMMTKQFSEKVEKVFVDENGTQVTADKNWQTAAIYGGFSLGFLYEYGAQNDKFEWDTQLIGAAPDGWPAGYICDTSGGNCESDPIAGKLGVSYVNIGNDTLVYTKALYPVGLNVKFMAQHFADLLKPDPACEGDPECEGKPFIQTGFTIRTLYKGEIEVPSFDNQTGETTYKKYTQLLASYADVPEDLNRKVEDLVDIPEIALVAPSVTAYMRQTITENNGYYRINMIPPELTGNLQVFARAEGYKFTYDPNADVKLVEKLSAGEVGEYDLYLEPINATQPSEPIKWSGWKYENTCQVNGVQWQITPADPTTIKVSNVDWANTVWGEVVTLLPDVDNSTAGYLWFGDNETGMFTDTGENTSSGTVCGKAISPVFDLSNYGFPVLDFKSWFEVESVDVAKGEFDQMEVGFIVPKEGNEDKLNSDGTITVYDINGEPINIKPDVYYPIYLLNPDYEPAIQDPQVPYSTQGVNALPVWKEFKVPVAGLAGLKVKFVFNFNSEDNLFNGFRGWGIDSVKVIDDMEDALAFPPEIPQILENDNSTIVENSKKVR